MPPVIGRLPATLLQREELVTQINEGRIPALATQLEFEQPSVVRQRLIDVADLECDVVETDRTRLPCFSHGCFS
jgi:hypothetical protein